MNDVAWPPQVGAWYLRWDRNEIFQVAAYNETRDIATLLGDRRRRSLRYG
jgi:hypothetical protein